MNNRLAAGVIAVLMILLARGSSAQDSTKPWKLEFRHGPMKVITVPYKDGKSRPVNILTFTIKNVSDVEAALALHMKAYVGTNPRKSQVLIALPDADAEEMVRRLGRNPKLINVQQINRHQSGGKGPGKLAPGESLDGIAVFGEFDREWGDATVTVAGLEPRAIHARIRKYGDAGFVLFHRAYHRHNKRVREAAGEGAESTDAYAVVQHSVIWKMKFSRVGDEFAPQIDPITLDTEGWDVVADPGPKIVLEKQPRFGG